MGVWFLSTATANKFAGDLSSLYPEEVHMEKSVSASSFKLAVADSSLMLNGKVDSAYVASIAQKMPNAVAEIKLVSDDFKAPKELNFAQQFMVNLFGSNEKEQADSLVEIKPVAVSKKEVSAFHLKQIVGSDPKFAHANFLSKDGNTLYVLKNTVGKKGQPDSNTIEVWNLKPEKPMFLGMKIENLYNFFMIFVFMAGGASVVLFLLSKKLLKMMHGVR